MIETGTSFYSDLGALPRAQRVVTIGNFDGVHRGHQFLIGCVIADARKRGARSLVITFEPHPSAVLRPDVTFQRLTTSIEKQNLLAASGADELLILPFTRRFAEQEPVDFLRRLRECATPAATFVGEGFRFGRDRAGDGETIREFGMVHGFETTVITRLRENGGVISSSSIRNALARGDIAAANDWLGRRYRLRGSVEHGAARGRELGFPTANLMLDESVCLPADGIYAAHARVVDGDIGMRQAIVYVGARPTFAGDDRLVEAYILDFNGDLYTSELEVEFAQFIRADAKFDSPEALAAQMARDEIAARAAFAEQTGAARPA
ncbi:MAG TPA: bifunctional riboflavin kinase/FAD synthetase [Thermomicrobiales bacterium]|nr:bifunctional riboflavin kinase/FAD synthetase [Thermomicrobiales bacterium]